MAKKIWSIILLCLTFINLLLLVALGVGATKFIEEFPTYDFSALSYTPFGIGGFIIAFLIVGGFNVLLKLALFLSSGGFVYSIINTRIASNRTIKIISWVFVWLYGAVSLILLILSIIFHITFLY